MSRSFSYVELGLTESKFGISYQARLGLELCEPTRKANKPVVVQKAIWNVSLKSQKFRDLAKALTGRPEVSGLDMQDLLNCPCEVTITHRETETGIYADIEIGRYRGSAKVPALMSDQVFLSLHHSDFNADVLEALPEKLRDKIKMGPTFKDLMLQRALADKPAADIIDDEIPF
jgi:hypothetical protein